MFAEELNAMRAKRLPQTVRRPLTAVVVPGSGALFAARPALGLSGGCD